MFFKRLVRSITILAFVLSCIIPQPVYAQNIPKLPANILSLTPAFHPVIIQGMRVHPENPLQFDFIIDTGDASIDVNGSAFKVETTRLIKYFLASLTVPEREMWVNLSPYEKDRIIAPGLGQTELGRAMLAQDYILKQLTSSLIYPDSRTGKSFWAKVYTEAHKTLGRTDIPVNTFSKVWIVPDKAVVYERGNTVYIDESHLKVMLESDYMAMAHGIKSGAEASIQKLSENIIRTIVIPELEKEVNTGKNFANLRQIYNAMILAVWFKGNLQKSLFGQVYDDRNKTSGVEAEDKTFRQKIYEQYVRSFKKGVYNYIREENDPTTGKVIPRKYFSGGLVGVAADKLEVIKAGPVPQGVLNAVRGKRVLVDSAMQSVVNHDLLITALSIAREALAQASATPSHENWEKAKRFYQEVLNNDERNTEGYNAMARIAFATGHLDEAEQEYEKILGIDSQNAEALDGLAGLVHSTYQQGNGERAWQIYQKLAQTDPTFIAYERPMNESNQWYKYQLDNLKVAPNKYDESGNVLHTPGISLVQWIGPEKILHAKLTLFIEDLRRDLEKANLLEYVAFLPPDRFHMTIADISLWPENPLEAQALERKIVDGGKEAFANLSGQVPPLNMIVAGLALSAGKSIVLRVHPIEKKDLQGIDKIREIHNNYLEPLGHGNGSRGAWIGHITVAYLLKDIPNEKYSQFKQIWDRYMEKYIGSLICDQVDLRKFDNMERWDPPIDVLPLKSRPDAAMLGDDLLIRARSARTQALSMPSAKNWKEMHRLYEEVLKDDKKNTEALNGAAQVAYETGSLDEAKRIYKEVIAIDSNNTEAWEGLVRAEFRQGHGEQGWEDYQILMKKDEIIGQFEEPMVASNAYFNNREGSLEIPQAAKIKYKANGETNVVPGLTAVQWIDERTEHYHQLVAFTDELKAELASQGLDSYFSFLPPETYHMTLYDIDTWEAETWTQKPWANRGSDKGEAIAEIVKQVTQTVHEIFKRLSAQGASSARMVTAGLTLSSGTSLVLRTHPVSREDLSNAVKVRNALKEGLLPLGVGKDNDLIGHITLCYIVKDIPHDDYLKVREVLRKYENRFVGTFDLDKIELREFESMDRWGEPLATVPLTSGSRSPDAALISTPGGIDFNPTMLKLQTKREGQGLNFPSVTDSAIEINGFTPVIIRITSMDGPLLSDAK